MARDFPEMTVVLNGGVASFEQAQRHLSLEGSEQEGWGPPVHGAWRGTMEADRSSTPTHAAHRFPPLD